MAKSKKKERREAKFKLAKARAANKVSVPESHLLRRCRQLPDLYVLFEGSGPSRNWRFYNKKTGVLIGHYYPATCRLFLSNREAESGHTTDSVVVRILQQMNPV